jgi:uncharacterized protein YjbI with pentapeptide repeats
MANPKDLEMLKQGVEKWNDWRMGWSNTVVDLSGADLSGINLIGANLRKANLSGADLSNTYLRKAELSEADLSGSNLTNADLSQAYMWQTNLSGAKMMGTLLEGIQASPEVLETLKQSTANPEHLKILQQGNSKWNAWRQENPGVIPVLSNADLRGLMDMTGVDLRGALMRGSDLSEVSLNGAQLEKANLIEATLNKTNLLQANLGDANLSNANLVEVTLRLAYLKGANLSNADLSRADLHGADLRDANLTGANLSEANLDIVYDRDGDFETSLRNADLSHANLRGASLVKANLHNADLSHANLEGAHLIDADLYNADLINSNLTNADLTGANLSLADLVETNFTDARISGCRIYGTSAWNVTLVNTSQKDMVISKEGEPVVTVDDLEVGQFIYLMLNNTKIRDVINTITSKGVLILGRFSDPQRKSVLDGLRDKLREFDLLPIVFDFDRPTDKDYTETVQTLAGMSMFVIADVTNPKSTPLELEATAKQFKIPFIPIIDISVDPRPFAMLVDLQKSFHWVLPTLQYASKEDLLDDENLKTYIIDRAVAKREELRAAKSQEPETILIRKKNAATPPS